MSGPVERNKRVVRRLVEEVLTGGRLDLVDELYHPASAHRQVDAVHCNDRR